MRAYLHCSCRLNDMHHACMKASDGKVVHVYAMYCMLAKGALLGPQNPSEMGPMRGSKSLAFWGRGGGPNRSYRGTSSSNLGLDV